MKIDEVITQTIVAIYKEPALAKILVLKGGSAIRLFDHITDRLSIDADFSISDTFDNTPPFFDKIEPCLQKQFNEYGLNVIDFRVNKKPKKRGKIFPSWWGGWSCEFKLVLQSHGSKTIETQRRNALIPEGSNSSIVTLDISAHEYCSEGREIKIQGVIIQGYTRDLLVLEKIRAICQQHPNYKYRSSKNRARDFYDIYRLTTGNMISADLIETCKVNIQEVFGAKEVPCDLLKALWDEDFINEQRKGFDQVKDTVSRKIDSFDVYVEHLRFLVKDILPDIYP